MYQNDKATSVESLMSATESSTTSGPITMPTLNVAGEPEDPFVAVEEPQKDGKPGKPLYRHTEFFLTSIFFQVSSLPTSVTYPDFD